MTKKQATRAEKIHLGKLADIGCIVCYNMGHPETPCTIHHIDRNRNHYRALPLCPRHHLAQFGGVGEAIHSGRRSWVANHGSEQELLEQVNRILNS
jgi:hypothetical protein